MPDRASAAPDRAASVLRAGRRAGRARQLPVNLSRKGPIPARIGEAPLNPAGRALPRGVNIGDRGMGYLALVATLVAGLPHAHGIADMEVVDVGGRHVLLTGSFTDGGIMRFDLAAGRPARLAQSVPRSAGGGTLGLSDLAVIRVGDQFYLTGAGRYADAPALRPLSAATASLGAPAIARARRGGDLSSLSRIEAIDFGSRQLVAIAGWDRPGLQVLEPLRDGTLQLKARLHDSRRRTLADVSALASARIGPRTFLFAASARESGVTAFEIEPTGKTRMTGVLGAAQGVGMSGTAALATVAVGRSTFVLAAATGSGTISSFRVSEAGRLTLADHAVDSLATRFAGVVALAAFAWGGRSMVVAGGADDGLTLFEVGGDGRLHVVEVIAQAPGWTLAGVQSVAAAVIGSEAQLFVTGAGAPGITQFRLDLRRLGPAVRGGARDDRLEGGPLDDLVEGGGGNDLLDGGGGNDRLVDGPGSDRLRGGPGSDIFVLVADGRRDVVLDFEPGSDRLDLSAWPMLYDRAQIAVAPTPSGAILRHRDETLVLRSTTGRQITAVQLDGSHFIFR